MLSLVGRCTPAELIATTRELRACLHARSGSGEEITLFLREGQPD
jgi:hypothetical protein